MTFKRRKKKQKSFARGSLLITLIIFAIFFLASYMSYEYNLAKNRELKTIYNQISGETEALKNQILDLLSRERKFDR